MLNADALRVIRLRTLKLLMGGLEAADGTVEMVREKAIAFADAGVGLAMGGTGEAAIDGLQTVVRART